MRGRRVLVASVALVVASSACGGDDKAQTPNVPDPNALAVYTAAPNEGILTALTDAFASENGGVQVDVTVADPAALVEAIKAGTADIVVLPDIFLEPIRGDVDTSYFGRNLTVIAVPTDNPGDVTDLSAFAPDSGLNTAVCGFGTGESGCEALILDQVAEGGFDAGIMFRNDLAVPDGVELIDLPEEQNIVIDLSYVVLDDGDTATSFTDFLGSDVARDLLTARGYLP